MRWGGGVGLSGKGVSVIQVLTSRAHEISVLVTHKQIIPIEKLDNDLCTSSLLLLLLDTC